MPFQWIRTELSAQRDRLILWLPVFFAIGIGIYFSLKIEPPFVLGAAALVFALTPLTLLYPLRHKSSLTTAAWLMSLVLFLIVLGFCIAQVRTMVVQTPILVKGIGPVTIEGTIEVVEKLPPGEGSRMILRDLQIERLAPDKTPYRVRLKVRKDETLSTGERITVLGKLNPPSAPVAPGAFDFQRYAFFKKIGAFGFTYNQPEILENKKPGRLQKIREKIIARIESRMDYPAASFAMALTTGERASISEEDWQAMRDAGLAHMLAISGLHVGLIAGVIFFMARLLMAAIPPLALHHPVKKYAAFIALCGAFAYMLIVGSTIPTQRAMMMTGTVLVAVILDRMALSLRLVCLAAFLVLLIAPEALWSASFQMSFAAVVCLIAFYESVRPYWSNWYRNAGLFRRILLYFVGVSMTTVIASLATAPMAMFHFQHLAIWSIPANLLAVPVMAFIIMPAAVLAYIGMPLGLDGPALWVMGQGIDLVIAIAHDVAAFPDMAWTPSAWPTTALIWMVFGGTILVLWKGRGRAIAVLPLMISIAIISLYKQPDILISSSGKLISFRDRNGTITVSSKRADRFAAEIWARHNGQDYEILRKWPLKKAEEGTPLRCGEWGCRADYKDQRIAFSFHPGTHREDCEWATVLIAKDPVKQYPCETDIVIDRFDLWREGAYAIWLDDPSGSPRVESVLSTRGTRPWTINNAR